MRAGRSGTTRACELRLSVTDAERRLWRSLRHGQLGWDFRRQHPVPPSVVDFARIAAQLIVEVDGGRHADSKTDLRRDAFLRRHGWRVMRFWNNDVLSNCEGVVQEIAAALPPPQPSPARGGGRSANARRVGA